MNDNHFVDSNLIDSIIDFSYFINANEEELNEINFILDLSVEDNHCKLFMQHMSKETKRKYLVAMW